MKPRKIIDWEKVDRLIEAGCSGHEIAPAIGIDSDTLYSRCVHDNGSTYSDYSAKLKAKGEGLIKAKQFQLAMSGNPSMLIWLGKNRLGQSDKAQIEQTNTVPQVIKIEFVGEE
jgi:hypothetical protein